MYSYQVVRARLALAIIIVSSPALALPQTEVVKNLSLTILPERLAICRLPLDAAIPECPPQARFWSVTRTTEELSIVLPEESVSPGWQAETGWRGLKVQGPLDFDLTGILASLVEPLAGAGVSIFAISTYDTDYILVREKDLEKAKRVLMASGHTFP